MPLPTAILASMSLGNSGLIPTGNTDLYCIIGHPITQVQAPGLFNQFFAEAGVDAAFVALDLDPDGVASFFETVRATANYRGGFVTVPHKGAAAACMDELTTRAHALGSVNAVKNDRGRLIGDMTDGPAFLEATRGRGLDVRGRRVAMIGGGHAATAIAHACAEQGAAELVLSVRRTDRHAELRRIVESVPEPPRLSFDLESLDGFDLVINGTSVGMGDDPNVPFPVDTMSPSSLIAEVVTRPRVTPWLKAALDRGCRVQYGRDMTRAQTQLVGPWWGLDVPVVDWDDG
jgi:shikimate dehydrogenase